MSGSRSYTIGMYYMIGSICIHPLFTFHLPLYRRSVHLQCTLLMLDLTIAPLVCFIFASLPSTRFPSSKIIDIAGGWDIIVLKERDHDFLNFNFFEHFETRDSFVYKVIDLLFLQKWWWDTEQKWIFSRLDDKWIYYSLAWYCLTSLIIFAYYVFWVSHNIAFSSYCMWFFRNRNKMISLCPASLRISEFAVTILY